MALDLRRLERMAKANSPPGAIIGTAERILHLDVKHPEVLRLFKLLDQLRPDHSPCEETDLKWSDLDMVLLEEMSRNAKKNQAADEVERRRKGLISTKNKVPASILRSVKKQLVPGPLHIARLQDKVTCKWCFDESFFTTTLVSRERVEEAIATLGLGESEKSAFAAVVVRELLRSGGCEPHAVCLRWREAEAVVGLHPEVESEPALEAVKAIVAERNDREVTCGCGTTFRVGDGVCGTCEAKKKASLREQRAPPITLRLDAAIPFERFPFLDWSQLHGCVNVAGGLGSAGVVIAEFPEGAVVVKPVKEADDIRDFIATELLRWATSEGRACGQDDALSRALENIRTTRSFLIPTTTDQGKALVGAVRSAKFVDRGVPSFRMWRVRWQSLQEYVVGAHTLYNSDTVTCYLRRNGGMFTFGAIVGFDMLINNWDRVPFLWANHGNGGNMLVSECGAISAIDHTVGVIRDAGNRAAYIESVCTMARSLAAWLAGGGSAEQEDAAAAAAAGMDRVDAFLEEVTDGEKLTKEMKVQLGRGVLAMLRHCVRVLNSEETGGDWRAAVVQALPEQMREQGSDIEECFDLARDVAAALENSDI